MTRRERLVECLEPLKAEATRLEPTPSNEAKNALVLPKFGGSPYAESQDEWPRCPTCQNDLTFILQFYTGHEQEFCTFYYCFECFPWGLTDEEKGQWVLRTYAFPVMDKYKAIKPHRDKHALRPCAVKQTTVCALPDWEGIESQEREISRLCDEIDPQDPWEAYEAAVQSMGCLSDYATIVGGFPLWVQGEVIPQCPQCGAEMPLLAQIDSEEAAKLMWGDAGLVYLFRCGVHRGVFHLELQCH